MNILTGGKNAMEPNERAHAYIVSAPPEAGARRAREIAQRLVCSAAEGRPCGVCRDCVKAARGIHPDIITIERQTDEKGKPKREIYVDQIRDLARDAAILPNESRRKVYIIRDAGTMNPSAQNALLKLLEEPPEFDAFILVSDSFEQLLETVRSRCVTVCVNADEGAPSPEMREWAEKYLALAAAGDEAALFSYTAKLGEMTGQDALDFTAAVTALCGDTLCRRLPDMGRSRAQLMDTVRLMARSAEYLRRNVGAKHVFGMIAVKTTEIEMRKPI